MHCKVNPLTHPDIASLVRIFLFLSGTVGITYNYGLHLFLSSDVHLVIRNNFLSSKYLFKETGVEELRKPRNKIGLYIPSLAHLS